MNYFLYNLFFLFIIITFSYFNSLHNIEKFTPGIRGLYRPAVRNTRIIGEGFYNKTTSNVSNLFRKIGIM